MAELKSKYFAPDGRWFDTREECEAYEKVNEIRDYIFRYNTPMDMAKALLRRYDIYERADWNALKTEEEPTDGT